MSEPTEYAEAAPEPTETSGPGEANWPGTIEPPVVPPPAVGDDYSDEPPPPPLQPGE